MSIDSGDLPPLEYAVLELLGARHRLGHDGWTLHTKVSKTVHTLEARGLVTWKHGVTHQSLLVWLTDEGKKAVLSEGYVPPILEKVLGKRWDSKHDQSAKCWACQHPYFRHWDTWEDPPTPVGCKYCSCREFLENPHA